MLGNYDVTDDQPRPSNDLFDPPLASSPAFTISETFQCDDSRMAKLLFSVLAAIGLALIGATVWAMNDLNRYNAMSPEEKAAEAGRNEEAKAEKARRNLVEHRDGKHCLSLTGRSHDAEEQVVASLRDPESYRHDRTTIFPVDDKGAHRLTITYGAKNGFGGMNRAAAHFTVQNSDCAVSRDFAA